VRSRAVAFGIKPSYETTTFDHGVAAELFMGKRKGGSLQPLSYRRFAVAAEAIRFAIEELPAVRALGAWMQVGDERFDGDDIQRLYESDKYPVGNDILPPNHEAGSRRPHKCAAKVELAGASSAQTRKSDKVPGPKM
jgi:hypothetical protein